MRQDNSSIQLTDINQVAYLNLHGIQPTLFKQNSLVVFQVPNNKKILDLIRDYNRNLPVPVLTYAHCLRKMRAMMLSLRSL